MYAYDTGLYPPKGDLKAQMPNMLRFVALYSCHFPLHHTLPILSPLSFPTSPISDFTPLLPFPKEMNSRTERG